MDFAILLSECFKQHDKEANVPYPLFIGTHREYPRADLA
jgi:hypothetical protein